MKNSRSGLSYSQQNEDNNFITQFQTVFEYLQEHVATASMVVAATGVPQKCDTPYKRDLEKTWRLWETDKKSCEKTRFKAWYLMTNPENALEGTPIQINLF